MDEGVVVRCGVRETEETYVRRKGGKKIDFFLLDQKFLSLQLTSLHLLYTLKLTHFFAYGSTIST